jgi:hypothetical protein
LVRRLLCKHRAKTEISLISVVFQKLVETLPIFCMKPGVKHADTALKASTISLSKSLSKD